MPKYGHDLLTIQPPVNRRLEGTASWINMLHDIDTELPKGWAETPNRPIISEEVEEKTRKLWTLNSKRAAA